LPPKPIVALCPSVKTQTNAADLLIEDAKARGTNKINLDFDPFESEEEFVFDESDELSAIEEELYLGIVDTVVNQGFSDVDSDAQNAIET